MDELVKPDNPVLDMNSRFSGITSLEDAKLDLEQTRAKFLELVNRDTIVVGQSLENDFKVLRLIHTRVIDTAMVSFVCHDVRTTSGLFVLHGEERVIGDRMFGFLITPLCGLICV